MILDIVSTNPDISHCLQKNPATWTEKPFQRSVRKGMAYGWFTSPQSFRLWFKDHPTESSFARGNRQDFEYLDQTRYSAPQALIALITETLREPLKSLDEHEGTDFKTTVSTTIWCHASGLNKFEALNKDDVKITTKNILPQDVADRLINVGPYDISVTASTLHKALNILCAMATFQAIRDNDSDIRWNEETLIKHAQVLARADVPYHARALFLQNTLHNRLSFSRVAPYLEEGTQYKFKFGNSQVQRHDAIAQVLTGGELLLDLGCGEGFHANKLAKTYKNIVAIDYEDHGAARKLKKVDPTGEKFKFVQDVISAKYVKDNEGLFEGADVLLAEMMEHNPLDVSMDILRAILATSVKRIVITVPDKSMNHLFGLTDEEFRHHDHDWEPTPQEWTTILNDVLADVKGWTYQTSKVGNVAGDSSVSLMTTFTRV